MYAIYAVNVSGGVSSSTCIFDDTSPALEHQLINPKLQLSAGAAGSLTITVPKTNAGFSVISRLTTTIKVKRDGTEIWRGRVLTESKDLWNNRVLFCEGCLAFLNDSIQSSSTAVTGQVPAYISALLTNHNNKVASNRQISLGTVSVEDPAGAISRYLNGETTLALLQKLVNELGGVLRTRFSGETILLDYLKEYPSSGTQYLDYGTPTLKYINYTTGLEGSSSTNYHTGYLDISDRPSGSRLKYSRIATTSANVSTGIAFYNSAKTFISGIQSQVNAGYNGYADYTTDIPSGAAYVRLTVRNPSTFSGFYVALTWEHGPVSQEIDLEENLLDFTRDWDNTDFCTVVLPRGARQDSEDSNLQSYLDISGATAPQYYTILDSKYLSKNDLYNPEYPSNGYGRIEKVVDFSDIGSGLDSESTAQQIATAKGKLIDAAADYLANQQYDGMTLELTAVDMHMVNPTTAAWNLLDKVTVKATPYFDPQGKTFAIVGMQIPLDAPEKTKYTLGPDSAPKVRRVLSLTKQQNQAQTELADSVESARTAGQDYTDGEVVSVKHWVDNESGVYTEISDAMGNESHLYVRLEGIDGAVQDADDHATQVEIKADEIYGKVTGPVIDPDTGQPVIDPDTGQPVLEYTVANLKSDGFHVADASGATLITGSMIDVDTIHVNKLYGGTIYFMVYTGTDPQTGEPVFAQTGTFLFNETQNPGVYQIGFGQFGAVDFGGVTDVFVHDPDVIYFSSLGKSLQDLLDEKADV